MTPTKYFLARVGIAFLGAAVAFLTTYLIMLVMDVRMLYRLVGAGLYGLFVGLVGWGYMRVPRCTEIDEQDDDSTN